MNITDKRTELILSYLSEHNYLESCSEYGESGYSRDGNECILFCNWNDVSRLVQDYLEEAGFTMEWNDEWYIDYDNDKAWRTAGDCWSWVCAIKYCDGYVLTPDDDLSEWVEACQSTDHNQNHEALPDWIEEDDLLELGWKKCEEEFESGFYGTKDSPTAIYQKIEKRVENLEGVLFRIDSKEQFRCTFQAFYLVGE